MSADDLTGLASVLADLSADQIRSSTGAMHRAVHLVARTGAEAWHAPLPDLVRSFEALGRVDLALGRLVEGHADAVRILEQAGVPAREGVYGVWASRSAGTGVAAARTDDGWRLTGQSRFSSGIDLVDRALLPGWLEDGKHLLFDVSAGDVVPDRDSWHTTAMDASRSFTVQVDLACDERDVVGPIGFYLDRPGFPVGGLGVAAVWAGGAASVLDQVVEGLSPFTPTAHQLRRVGVMEQAVWAACTAVEDTAVRIASRSVEDVVREAGCARTAVVTACEQVVDEAGRVVGPGGLSGNARLARTLADLVVYVRQHHLDLTWEALGRHALRERPVHR